VLLSRVAAVESITVLDADLDAKIAEIAGSRHQTPAAIRGYLEKEGAMPVLRDRVLEEKVLEWLLENAELMSAPAAEAPAAE
jgi:FKBP-type peptidyl-prolyl cis-trans isomerase (trigger factor)